MTGLPDHGKEKFNSAASNLKSLGYDVANPAETDNGSTNKPWIFYMRKDIAMMMECDMVCALHDWRQSRGALIEVKLAHSLGIPVVDEQFKAIPPPEPFSKDETTETICQEADRLVSHDRQDTYGHPHEDFSRTGRIWGAILDLPDVPAYKVGLCMAAVKISREVNKPKRDNMVDLAGYAKCVSMIHKHTGKY